MHSTIVIINGKGGVGKDTLIAAAEKHCHGRKIFNISSIDTIKKAAVLYFGWNPEDKSDKARKFLADLKKLSQDFNGYPNKDITLQAVTLADTHKGSLIFVHIREPENIRAVKDMILAYGLPLNIRTMLVKGRKDNAVYGNEADDNVDNYDYDIVFENTKNQPEAETEFCSLADLL